MYITNSIFIYHLCDVSSVKSFSKHGSDKDVDEEGHKQSNGRLHKEVLIGLLHLVFLCSINVTRLQTAKQTEKIQIFYMALLNTGNRDVIGLLGKMTFYFLIKSTKISVSAEK